MQIYLFIVKQRANSLFHNLADFIH